MRMRNVNGTDDLGIFSLGSATVGRNVRVRREECGMTRQQLADTLRLGGLSDGEVWWVERLEDGDVTVSVEELLLLGTVLDASPSWLLMPSGCTDGDDQVWLPGAPKEHEWGAATRRRAGAIWAWLIGYGPISFRLAMPTYPPADVLAMTDGGWAGEPEWITPHALDTPGWYDDGSVDDGTWDYGDD